MKDWIMEVCPELAEWQAEVIAVQVRISVEAERERCAQLVEPSADHLVNPQDYMGGSEGVEMLLELAETIRSRGKK